MAIGQKNDPIFFFFLTNIGTLVLVLSYFILIGTIKGNLLRSYLYNYFFYFIPYHGVLESIYHRI